MWVFDSISIKDAGKRRDFLKEKLTKKFPGFNFFAIISETTTPWSIRNATALCEFSKETYGHQILIIAT